jgi:plastocyanin
MSVGRASLLCVLCVVLSEHVLISSVAASEKTLVTHEVTIENMEFRPSHLTVHSGDQIVFSNKDLFPHTATADDKSFDSHSIAPGASWKYRARRPGQFAYKCSFHPVMLGMITVR